jgi:hypothetical protein
LLAAPLPSDIAACLDECLKTLPPHARIFQTGVMLARGERAVRLCIDNLSNEEIVRCVARWRNDAEAAGVAEAIAAVAAAVVSIKLVVDVAAQVGPRIGLECYAVAPHHVPVPERWQPLLATLVARGVCLPAKRAALAAVPPHVRERDNAEIWPADLAALSALVGREAVFALWLHHIKISCAAGRWLHAKAYIAASRAWLAEDV